MTWILLPTSCRVVLIKNSYQHRQDTTEKAQCSIDVGMVFFVPRVDKTFFRLSKNFNERNVGHDTR